MNKYNNYEKTYNDMKIREIQNDDGTIKQEVIRRIHTVYNIDDIDDIKCYIEPNFNDIKFRFIMNNNVKHEVLYNDLQSYDTFLTNNNCGEYLYTLGTDIGNEFIRIYNNNHLEILGYLNNNDCNKVYRVIINKESKFTQFIDSENDKIYYFGYKCKFKKREINESHIYNYITKIITEDNDDPHNQHILDELLYFIFDDNENNEEIYYDDISKM